MRMVYMLALALANVWSLDCGNLPQYQSGSSYQVGDQVQNQNNGFKCKVAGWCNTGGAYEPGVGWASDGAWQALGECSTTTSSSVEVSSSSVELSSSVEISSSFVVSSSSDTGSGCGDAPVWTPGAIDPQTGDQFQSCSPARLFEAKNNPGTWESPSCSGSNWFWEDLGSCGGTQSSSSELSSSSEVSSSSVAVSSSVVVSSSTEVSSSSLVISSSSEMSSSSQAGSNCDNIPVWQAGSVDPNSGDQFQSCSPARIFEAKNNPGTWESPSCSGSNWFWEDQGECSLAQSSSVQTSSSSVISSSSEMSSSSEQVALNLDQSQDIGNTGATGSSDLAGDQWSIRGSGGDIWGSADAMHFRYQEIQGDFVMTALVEDVENVDYWTKFGLMVRDDLGAGAKNAFMMIRPEGGVAYQWRGATNQGTSNMHKRMEVDNYYSAPRYLGLTRKRNVYTAYHSIDGQCWTEIGKSAIEMSDVDYIGIALTSHNFGNLATATMSEVQLDNFSSDINSGCPRAVADAWFEEPSDWVVKPSYLEVDEWKYTFTNPNSNTAKVFCKANQTNSDSPYRLGGDDPQCPDSTYSPAWAQLSYNDQSWNTGAGGFGSATMPEDKLTTSWPSNQQNIWLRKQVVLSQYDVDNLVFYGRWDDGITIYVNGVLATHSKDWSPVYKYMGLRDAARAALVPGQLNEIAIRAKNGDFETDPLAGDGRFVDISLATLPALAQVGANPGGVQATTEMQAFVDILEGFMRERAVGGAVLAIQKDGEIVLSKGFGYTNNQFDTPMAHDAILRLASNDKPITQSLVWKLREEGLINSYDQKYFDILNNVALPTGKSVGVNMEKITIDHLLRHESGINGSGGAFNVQDRYNRMGVSEDSYDASNNLSWMYTLGTSFEPGSDGEYSSDGYFMLRHLVAEVSGESVQERLDQLMAPLEDQDIIVSYERMSERHPREPGYLSFDETYDRWLELDDYYAFGASAQALAKYYWAYDLHTGKYLLDDQLNLVQGAGGGGFFGSMAGTWSVILQDGGFNEFSLVLIVNQSGVFDDVVDRFNAQIETYKAPGGPWN